jgi:hypothetical protein
VLKSVLPEANCVGDCFLELSFESLAPQVNNMATVSWQLPRAICSGVSLPFFMNQKCKVSKFRIERLQKFQVQMVELETSKFWKFRTEVSKFQSFRVFQRTKSKFHSNFQSFIVPKLEFQF